MNLNGSNDTLYFTLPNYPYKLSIAIDTVRGYLYYGDDYHALNRLDYYNPSTVTVVYQDLALSSRGIAVDLSTGDVLVSDSSYNTIWKFKYNGPSSAYTKSTYCMKFLLFFLIT